MKNPYISLIQIDDLKIRYFDRQLIGNPNIWHKDEVDREIFLVWSNCQCMIQMDNSLPVFITRENFKIEKELYHRLIIPDPKGKIIIGIVE